MYFDEDFVKSLPDDWNYAAVMINEKYNLLIDNLHPSERYSATQELWPLLEVLRENKRHNLEVPDRTGHPGTDIINMQSFIKNVAQQAQVQIDRQNTEDKLKHYEDVYRIALGNVFHFEFSEGDLKRIQKLVNELRDLISATEELEQKHKQRVLRKLEKLQSELHKKIRDLDLFYGTIIELSVTARIVGENFKPVVDRIRELVGIVWPVQARAFELPSDAPFELPGQTEDEKP